jgi:hypothetical protein
MAEGLDPVNAAVVDVRSTDAELERARDLMRDLVRQAKEQGVTVRAGVDAGR